MTKYRVAVDNLEELAELDGSWKPIDYIAILSELDVNDAAEIAPEELRDMVLLALQDLDPPVAAAVLLKYKLGTRLTAGQINNYSIESQYERLWEQSADLDVHLPMFDIASLLNAVNAMAFPKPDALRVSLNIKCADAAQLTLFEDAMDRALLVRLLSAGMNETAILNRLFGEQIADGKISDADSIIWRVNVDSTDENLIRLTITSSAYWLRGIRETESFEWDSELVAQ